MSRAYAAKVYRKKSFVELQAINKLRQVKQSEGIAVANYVVHQFLVAMGYQEVADAWDEAENRVFGAARDAQGG